jgi:hypothetical protein
VPALPARRTEPYVRLTVIDDALELDEAKGHAATHVDRSIEAYIERCRQRVPSFVDANFSLRQTWELQRPTLWRDLAYAPVNSAWALPYVAIHKAVEVAERVGYPQPARWAKRLPSGIKTGYQRQIEQRICRDLLEWDRIETPEPESQDGRSAKKIADLIQQFSSGRAIVSDLIGTVLTLGMSWAILGSASLSLTSIAHGMARKSAHDRAASRFFLGKKAGSAFYNVFPPAVHVSTTWTIVICLAVSLTAGAMVCTMASDPIRKILGFHRNRLNALHDDIERELIVFSHKRLR